LCSVRQARSAGVTSRYGCPSTSRNTVRSTAWRCRTSRNAAPSASWSSLPDSRLASGRLYAAPDSASRYRNHSRRWACDSGTDRDRVQSSATAGTGIQPHRFKNGSRIDCARRYKADWICVHRIAPRSARASQAHDDSKQIAACTECQGHVSTRAGTPSQYTADRTGHGTGENRRDKFLRWRQCRTVFNQCRVTVEHRFSYKFFPRRLRIGAFAALTAEITLC
jgi:hypothetical protein